MVFKRGYFVYILYDLGPYFILLFIKMKKIFLGTFVLFIAATLILISQKTNAATSDYQITVDGGTVKYNVASSTLTLPAFTVSTTTWNQNIYSGAFGANSFVLEDLYGDDQTWHIDLYSTGMVGTNSADVIPVSQIYIKWDTINTNGVSSCATIYDTISSTALAAIATSTAADTLRQRNATENGETCNVWTKLTLWIAVPAYQSVDTYTAAITITEMAGVVSPSYNALLTYAI